jgi:serine/threonine-protein kinase
LAARLESLRRAWQLPGVFELNISSGMKALGKPVLILVLLYLSFVACLLVSGPFLPERVATHFDGAGRPNGWMSRNGHLLFTLGLGTGLPFVMVGTSFLVRYLPSGMINIPRRDYWLVPERRGAACAYLLRHSLWLGCLTVAFVLCIHLLILESNTGGKPRLSSPTILGLAGGYVAGLACWIVTLFRHFSRPPAEQRK